MYINIYIYIYICMYVLYICSEVQYIYVSKLLPFSHLQFGSVFCSYLCYSFWCNRGSALSALFMISMSYSRKYTNKGVEDILF